MDMLQVPYRDRAIAVCVKPPDCLSEPAQARNLPALLSSYFQTQNEPEPVFTVHRLDREVGGLSVLGRTHEAAASLIAQFSAHTVQKEYYAVLRGIPQASHAVLEDLLFRDAAKNKSYVVNRMRKGVRQARLEYVVLETVTDGDQPLSLVRIRLFTGRTHQIRVQFASRKLPLVGDVRYGGRDARCNIALFSCALGFTHPTENRRMHFYQRPALDCFPWNLFSAQSFDSVSPFS